MAGVYNRFQLKLEKKELLGQAKGIAQKVIRDNDYKFGDWLVWDTIEESDTSIEAENYLGFDYTDLDKSKDLFSRICRTIIQELPEIRFMGNYCFEYSNVDHADHVFAFYRDGIFVVYEGGTDDGEGYLLTRSVCAFDDGNFSDPKILEYDRKEHNEELDEEYDEEEYDEEEDNNAFSEVRDAFENGEFPDISEDEPTKKGEMTPPPQNEGEKKIGKHKLVIGRFYHVEYSDFGENKEIIGKLEDYFSKRYEFKRFGSAFETEYVEQSSVITITEVFETSDTLRIKKEYEKTLQEIKDGEIELSALRSRFYEEYSENGSNWERRQLTQTEDKLEEIEVGKTYLVKVKQGFSVVGNDAVLVVDRSKDVIGERLRCLTCDPNISKYDVTMIRPVIAINLDELTHELLIDEKASEIQRQRSELYNKINDLHGKCRQLREEYRSSFSRG